MELLLFRPNVNLFDGILIAPLHLVLVVTNTFTAYSVKRLPQVAKINGVRISNPISHRILVETTTAWVDLTAMIVGNPARNSYTSKTKTVS